MTHFDEIYEIAVDNYGIITYADAIDTGITSVELRRFVTDGRLEHIGQGVYKLVRYVPTPYDQYAAAVALVGQSSYVYGESVLAMYNLALVNPRKTIIATPKRIRKTLPAWIRLVSAQLGDVVTYYEGIPCQRIDSAFRSCKTTIMKSRLAVAVDDAVFKGLIDEISAKVLRKDLEL
jgi:predicted transcriptional regulator of viral defense system